MIKKKIYDWLLVRSLGCNLPVNHCWTRSRVVTSLWQWLKEWFHRQAAKMILLRRVAGLALRDRVSELNNLREPWYQAAALLYREEASWIGINTNHAPWLPPSGGAAVTTIWKENRGRKQLPDGVGMYGNLSGGPGRNSLQGNKIYLVCSIRACETASMTTLSHSKMDECFHLWTGRTRHFSINTVCILS